MKKGTLCISLDTELMWGRHAYPNYRDFYKRTEKERDIVKRLLGFLKKHDISATWAVVGHLFLEKCDLQNGHKHPEITKPTNMLSKKDWFELDPCTNLEKDPQWYAPDIISQIQKVRGQEIGSHSFSHILFGDAACSEDCAESEIKECVKLAKRRNIKLKSFVFPVNSVGHLDILKKYGFSSFRGKKEKYSSFLGEMLNLFFLTPPVYLPKEEAGLVNIPASMYFVSGRGLRKHIPRTKRFYQAKRGIDQAIKEGKIFHLWTHPTDFADDTNYLLGEFDILLQYANEKRTQGLLEIKTMSKIAEEFYE